MKDSYVANFIFFFCLLPKFFIWYLSYSYLRDSTGLVCDTLIIWNIIVNREIITSKRAERSTSHHDTVVWYAKLVSHLFISRTATGRPAIIAIITHRRKPEERRLMIRNDVDPNTFRIPISLVFDCATNEEMPSRPRHAIRTASKAKNTSILPSVSSVLY